MTWHSDVLEESRYSKSHLFWAEQNGDAYGTSVRVADVADDGTLNMLIFNPYNSSKNLCWVALEVASEGKAYVEMYGDVTTNVTGTSLFQCNKYAGSTHTSIARTEYNGSYVFTSANLVHQTLLPGGSGPQSVGGKGADAEVAIGGPGHNVLVQLTNKGGAAKDMSIRIVWTDCPI